jgi:hypothetical protein
MTKRGKRNRDERLLKPSAGGWGSYHSLFVHMAGELYHPSGLQASAGSGNGSWFPYAAVPVLLAALQSFIIEYECTLGWDRTCLEPLTQSGFGGLLKLLETRYRVGGKLLEEARDLIEVRNEMIHPVPLPTGTEDNCPAYLRHLKEQGLLESTGEATDYCFMAQLASHRLFAWSCRVTRDLFQRVANSNPERPCCSRLSLIKLQISASTLTSRENRTPPCDIGRARSARSDEGSAHAVQSAACRA